MDENEKMGDVFGDKTPDECKTEGKIELLKHLIARWELVNKGYLLTILSSLTTK